jgi:uncharacterized damage-inducible protein DinB
MKRAFFSLFGLSLALVLVAPTIARAASGPAQASPTVAAVPLPMVQPATQPISQEAAAQDKNAPNYDIKGEALVDEADLGKKFVSLAEAIPADKFTWRPAEGVRSIGEVYLHVAQSNYGIMKYAGSAIPEGKDSKTFEKSTTDKAKIVAELKASFDWVHQQMTNMSNADLAQPLKELGPEANKGDVLYLVTTHAHEHLGQSIAYARVNGVTPPWTKAQMDKAKQKKDGATEE